MVEKRRTSKLTRLYVFVIVLAMLSSFFPKQVFAMGDNAKVDVTVNSSGMIVYGGVTPTGLQTNGLAFAFNNQSVRLTGVHMLLWPDASTRYKQEYFSWLKGWGINTIMVDFGWNFLEPAKGNYSQDYLALMDNIVAEAKTDGIYVIFRMCQWGYPKAYQADFPPWPDSWILGFPTWIGQTPNFWENYDDCWSSYVAMWTMLARHYANEPYVASFDLFAEPGTDIGPGIYDPAGTVWAIWGSATCSKVTSVLFNTNKLYEKTINAIHDLSNKPIIIEGFMGTYFKNVGDTNISLLKPNSQNFAIGFSVYDWWEFKWLDTEILSVAQAWNVPCMVTEFGVYVNKIVAPSYDEVAWVEQACQNFSIRGMSWFYWAFGPGPDGGYNLVKDGTDDISPILSVSLPKYSTGLLPDQR